MTDKRCATCRHWDANGKEFEIAGGYRCSYETERRKCSAVPATERPHDGTDETSAAVLVDCDWSGAAMLTRPSFGCVLWEEKT